MSGKLLPLSHAATLLDASPDPLWRGFRVQHYRLRPTETPAHTLGAYSVVLQVGPPVRVEWHDQGRDRQEQINPAHVSLHPVGDVPGFRLFDEAEIVEITLTPQFATQVLRGTKAIAPQDFAPAYGVEEAQVQRIGTALLAEMTAGYPGGSLLGEGLATALVAHLFSRHGGISLKGREAQAGLSPTDTRRLVTFIHDNLDGSLSLETMAALVSISPHHFALRFRQTLGLPPHQYVTGQRVERARHLLQNGKTPLAEIARAVGFASQSHFTHHFKRIVGVAPGQYRRNS